MTKRFSEEIRRMLEGADAIWTYEGPPRPEAPHALFTSGRHSDGYADVGKFLKDHQLERVLIANFLLEALYQVWNDKFTRVVGADTSSTALAADVAEISAVHHIRMVKTDDGKDKRQVWHPDNPPLLESDITLHVEELITTTLSAIHVRTGIEEANPGISINHVPFLPVVVERSNPDDRVKKVSGSIILPLLQLEIRNYHPSYCPYCLAGSEAIKPKVEDNWKKLTGK